MATSRHGVASVLRCAGPLAVAANMVGRLNVRALCEPSSVLPLQPCVVGEAPAAWLRMFECAAGVCQATASGECASAHAAVCCDEMGWSSSCAADPAGAAPTGSNSRTRCNAIRSFTAVHMVDVGHLSWIQDPPEGQLDMCQLQLHVPLQLHLPLIIHNPGTASAIWMHPCRIAAPAGALVHAAE